MFALAHGLTRGLQDPNLREACESRLEARKLGLGPDDLGRLVRERAAASDQTIATDRTETGGTTP